MNLNPNQNRDFDVKCNHISRRVEIWCGILGISELAFLAQATLVERVGGSFEIRFWTAMSLVWIVWIITQRIIVSSDADPMREGILLRLEP